MFFFLIVSHPNFTVPPYLACVGGPGTINTAMSAVDEGTPVVTIEGSGMAADMISYAWRYLHDFGYVQIWNDS